MVARSGSSLGLNAPSLWRPQRRLTFDLDIFGEGAVPEPFGLLYLFDILDHFGIFVDNFFTMVGLGAQSGTNAEHIAKLDARFHAMLQALGCHENSMARLGELSITTVQALETLADDRKDLREFLKDGLGLDPQAAPKVPKMLEAGSGFHPIEAFCLEGA